MKKHSKKIEHEYDSNGKSLKKRETCRGGKPHDFVLVLPDHVTYNEDYQFNPEAYYQLEEERIAFDKDMERRALELGITNKYRYSRDMFGVRRCYRCSVCYKKE